MNVYQTRYRYSTASILARWILVLASYWTAPAGVAAIAQSPLFLTASVPPIVMLTLGRDHKLYYEAYNDASDLDGDGAVDIHYKPSIDYYGYFDSYKCYSYESDKFTPVSTTLNKKCSGYWSGDFLNYLTTSRMDALRKVLYGGTRSTDTDTSTVLKRVFIPQDSHSWGKEYTSVAVDGYSISDYTPLALPASGKRHFFASTTLTGASSDPLLRVALDNVSTNRIWGWLSKERPVAGSTITPPTGSNQTITATDYKVYVDVCKDGMLEDNCKAYSDGSTTVYKPTGLLHTYGDQDLMYFGLLTGSYKKNISGGVLRKNITSFKEEVDPLTGRFIGTGGIVDTINKLRIVTFRYPSTANYDYASGWITTRPINEGEAAEWGNPVAEMMYEGLRYFAGKASATSAFKITSSDTPDATLGLPVATWKDPYKAASSGGGGYLRCAKPMQLVISDINPSYDTNQVPGTSFGSFTGDLDGLDVSALADTIWSGESEGSNIFIGQSGAVVDNTPSPKPVSSFKDIRGLSPEEPTKQGGYYAGSVALFGRQTDLNPVTDDQKANTLAVALASPLPRIEIPVADRIVTLVPFAKSVAGSSISATSTFQPTNQIVDFYVETIVNTSPANADPTVNSGRAYGKFRINYEDVEQAADHDMDAIVEYTFTVTASNQIQIDLNSTYAAGGIVQHMGYVISGTTADGTYLEVRDKDTASGSDTSYFLDTPPGQLPGGIRRTSSPYLDLTATRTFTVGDSPSANFIKHDPLWYAAKWGSNDLDNDSLLDQKEWDADEDGSPDGYFLVTNAGKLPEQLGKAFAKALNVVSSASAVAANSTRLDVGSAIYQAKFNTSDWSGYLLTYEVDANTGALSEKWEASALIPTPSNRKIYTYSPNAAQGSRGIAFQWDSLLKDTDNYAPMPFSQQRYLDTLSINDGKGEARLNWLRGDSANEQKNAGEFRDRTNLLGDIVNSDPIFVGHEDYGFSALPGVEGTSYRNFRLSTSYLGRRPMVYVGANDGMLHGFDANVTGGGTEIFAYVPNAVFPKLSELASPSYNHRYYVDGVSGTGDVYYGSAWHTLLVGATGAGGRALFALDVTHPDNFGPASVLWEFTHFEDADLGYTFGQPTLGRTEDGHWVAIAANGYDSDNGHAVLFVLDAQTGAVLQKIDTGQGDPGSKNGLSTPIAVDTDNDRSIDSVYAGDLYGNLWKFDLSGNVGTWNIPGGQPLFVACESTGGSCPANKRQAITGKPNVGPVGTTDTGQNGEGVMVYFGTGKYFEAGDNIVPGNPQKQTFYGLWDQGNPITSRGDLQVQTITYEGMATTVSGATTKPLRVITKQTVCYSATIPGCTASDLKKGWLLDFVLPPPDSTAKGERVVSFPLLRRGLVVFSTLIPESDPCNFGGKSWLMEVDALNGGESASGDSGDGGGYGDSGGGSGGAAFDTNGDGVANSDDAIIINGEKHYAGGIDVGVGIFKTPAVIEGKNADYKYVSGSSGQIGTVYDKAGSDPSSGASAGTRWSWRQLR